MSISRSCTHGYLQTLLALSRALLLFCFSLLLSVLFAEYCSSSVRAETYYRYLDTNEDVIIETSSNPFDEDPRLYGSFPATRALPAITVQPVNYRGYVGETFTFSLTASNATGYQWLFSRDGINFSPTDLPGNATNTITGTITESRLLVFYRCRVFNGSNYIDSDIVRIIEKFTILDSIQWLGNNLITQLFNFSTPWGITFGALIVGVFGAPLLVKAYKKFF